MPREDTDVVSLIYTALLFPSGSRTLLERDVTGRAVYKVARRDARRVALAAVGRYVLGHRHGFGVVGFFVGHIYSLCLRCF